MKDKTYSDIETSKALANFGYAKPERDFIKAFAEVKKACIVSIQEHSHHFKDKVYNSIITSIDSIISGDYDTEFILPFKQGGAGTSINYNFNEVIANLSMDYHLQKTGESVIIDPIEDINLYQSTNDVFPTALTIMVFRHLQDIENKIISLQETLITKENEYSSILITGRTEMQSALPITLGQVFGSWSGCIERDRWRLNKQKDRIRNIPLGGTAIGTCFFAPASYVFIAEKKLREITGLSLCRSQNLTDEISNLDKFIELANTYGVIANNLFKISSDLMLYTSSFIHEINQPDLQYGSSIMAAKTNPVILEYVKGLSIDISGEKQKIENYAQNGQLQLNPFLPFITGCFINIYTDLINAIDTLTNKFLLQITPDLKRIEKNMIDSHILLNTLIPVLGYNKIKEIYKIIESTKIESLDNLKDIIKKYTTLDDLTLDNYFHPLNATSFLKEETK